MSLKKYGWPAVLKLVFISAVDMVMEIHPALGRRRRTWCTLCAPRRRIRMRVVATTVDGVPPAGTGVDEQLQLGVQVVVRVDDVARGAAAIGLAAGPYPPAPLGRARRAQARRSGCGQGKGSQHAGAGLRPLQAPRQRTRLTGSTRAPGRRGDRAGTDPDEGGARSWTRACSGQLLELDQVGGGVDEQKQVEIAARLFEFSLY